MIETIHFTDSELLKLKELTEYSRARLHRLCAGRDTCTGCEYNHLCIYYRDLFIISKKELKRRFD